MEVAVISENVNHLTGGRYYTWMLATALQECGFQTTIYTNREPTFLDYFTDYKKPRVQVVAQTPHELRNVDIKADIYVGSPINGGVCALKNGKKYNKPAFPIIFDPLPMLRKYLKVKVFPGWREYVELMRADECSVITLCKATHPHIYSWLNKKEEQLIPIYPCINSIAKKRAKTPTLRRGYVVFASRLVNNKKFDHVVWACRQNDIDLYVISSISGIKHKNIVAQYRMSNLTKFFFKVSEEEKFEIIRGASAMINGAIFEGFGIWAAEAIECGTPLVCYDYPTLREIADFSKADNVYFAKYGNHRDLAQKLRQCLHDRKYAEEKNVFGFNKMVERVKNVFSQYVQG